MRVPDRSPARGRRSGDWSIVARPSVLPVVPAPASIQPADAAPFILRADTRVLGDAEGVAEVRTVVETRTGLTLGGAPDTDTPDADAPAPGTITVAVDPDVAGGAAESYRLEASESGVDITGADAAGLFYGIQTLAQLIAPARDAADADWIVPAVVIDDAPRFAYRGVMLDVARHFHDVDTVKAYIDRASSLKFNVLHLHLTDDQGWRLESRVRPLLTEKASATAVGGDAGGFFTQDDYREIIAYAAAHHMTVVPEIDLPGHTHAVSLAYPELSEEPVLSDHIRTIVRDYGGELPVNGTPYDGMAVGFSSLKIHDEATWAFLADVLGEVAALTPGPYLHIGGDEALGTSDEDYAAFVDRVTALAASLGKTPIAWHEAGSSAGIAPTTVGQYWGYVTPEGGMDDKARGFVALGSQVILSPADAIYLDMKFDADAPLGLTWANGVTSIRRSYEWDPATIIDGITDDQILGVEAPLWTETARTLADIDALAFPRAASAAEAAWSPAVGESDLRTWDSFAARLGALAPLWTRQGIGFTPLADISWTATGDADQNGASDPASGTATDTEADGRTESEGAQA